MLSVIVPVRNDPAHLSVCLAGIRASSYADHEVIVVDDASTDASAAVASESGARLLRLERQSGPAVARNRGADVARGEVLLFVDADVSVHPETLAEVVAGFGSDSSVAALFGSYDRRPLMPQFVSQYKNLLHHFVHQHGRKQASTFWAGCGAIKRSVFLEIGGFDAGYGRPCIEDIELGVRLLRSGHEIILRKSVQATHLKRWTFWGLLKSDVWDRGVPWTRLMLRERNLPSDLNLAISQRFSALAVYLLAAMLALAAVRQPGILLAPLLGFASVAGLDRWSALRGVRAIMLAVWTAVAATLLAIAALRFGAWALVALIVLLGIVATNRRLYAFFARERGLVFAGLALPMQLLYYLYSGCAAGIGLLQHTWGRMRLRGQRAKVAVQPR